MKEFLKDYLPPAGAGIVMLLSAPALLGVIFLSGDSCNSSDTSASMRLVALVIGSVNLILSFVINTVFMILRKRKPGRTLAVGTAITWLISSGVYLLFTEALISSAFS